MSFNTANDIVVVDAGLNFRKKICSASILSSRTLRILTENRDKVRGILITHGHEDHIGGLPYVLKHLNVPVYGTKLTLGLIEGKLKEAGLLGETKRILIQCGFRSDSSAPSKHLLQDESQHSGFRRRMFGHAGRYRRTYGRLQVRSYAGQRSICGSAADGRYRQPRRACVAIGQHERRTSRASRRSESNDRHGARRHFPQSDAARRRRDVRIQRAPYSASRSMRRSQPNAKWRLSDAAWSTS